MSHLREIAVVFFRLGCIAFGGPAAHIALLEQEVVEKRRWLDRAHFLDLIGATNLIPGPNSTEMVMHCGYERGGRPGLFIAGACFILPAVAMTAVLAWLYGRYGALPAVEPFLYGIKPAVLAIIASALDRLGRKAVKNWELGMLAILVLSASLLGVNEILALLVGGVVGAAYFSLRYPPAGPAESRFWPLLLFQAPAAMAGSLSVAQIFWIFLKIGATLYGSGYVLFAYLDAELVAPGWMTRPELLDAVAVGQFTPGPVLSTATFIGYQLGGWAGAAAATAGIFLPSFLLVLLLNPLVPRLRENRVVGFFLDAVNAAAVAVMAAVLLQMAGDAILDWRAVVIAVLSFLVVFRFPKVNAVWVVIGGAVLGWVLQWM